MHHNILEHVVITKWPFLSGITKSEATVKPHSDMASHELAIYVLYSLTHCPNMHTVLTFAHVEGIQSMCSPTFCVTRKYNISWLSPSETIPKFVFLCGPLEGFEALTFSH